MSATIRDFVLSNHHAWICRSSRVQGCEEQGEKAAQLSIAFPHIEQIAGNTIRMLMLERSYG
jgi:hypothetical protein